MYVVDRLEYRTIKTLFFCVCKIDWWWCTCCRSYQMRGRRAKKRRKLVSLITVVSFYHPWSSVLY